MSKYNRYLFIKRLYPDYVIFLVNKDKLITYNKDLEIVKVIGITNFFKQEINYLIIDNLEIKEKKEYTKNNYFYYFKLILLLEIISYIKKLNN